jgi:hypothetical protein
MKKQTKLPNENTEKKTWRNRKEMISKNIALEVDLENRKLFFHPEVLESLHFDFGTNNMDHVIETYLDPVDLQRINLSLTEAKQGQEKPIPFHFTHPLTSKIFKFEYRYQIVYVKYASTRLHGELVKLGSRKIGKDLKKSD